MNREDDDLLTYEEVSRVAKRLEEELIETRDELTKYKRAFEILKEKLDIDVTGGSAVPEFDESYTLWAGIEPATISKEEYEILEELMEYDR